MKKHTNKSKDRTAGKVTPKQIAAIIGIVLLLLLYAVTFITAFIDTKQARSLFGLCFFATLALPLVIWIYIRIFSRLTGRSTAAGFNTGDKKEDDENI